jgi:hypothetical protein
VIYPGLCGNWGRFYHRIFPGKGFLSPGFLGKEGLIMAGWQPDRIFVVYARIYFRFGLKSDEVCRFNWLLNEAKLGKNDRKWFPRWLLVIAFVFRRHHVVQRALKQKAMTSLRTPKFVIPG